MNNIRLVIKNRKKIRLFNQFFLVSKSKRKSVLKRERIFLMKYLQGEFTDQHIIKLIYKSVHTVFFIYIDLSFDITNVF